MYHFSWLSSQPSYNVNLSIIKSVYQEILKSWVLYFYFVRPQTTDDGNVTSSELRWTPSAEDAGKVLSCRAHSPALPSAPPLVDEWPLDIFCEYTLLGGPPLHIFLVYSVEWPLGVFCVMSASSCTLLYSVCLLSAFSGSLIYVNLYGREFQRCRGGAGICFRLVAGLYFHLLR